MKKRSLAILLVGIVGLICLIGTVTPAIAQGLTMPKNTVIMPGLKSPSSATAWSLFGTVVPTFMGFAAGNAPGGMMVLFGVTMGPSMGYFYVGKSGRGLAGAGIRLGAMTVSVVGLALNYNDKPGELTASAIMFLAPLGFLVGDIIHDIANAHKAAEKYNEKIAGKNAGTSLTIAPEYFGSQKAIGIKAQIKF
jgi:hypothetical protein